jgi:hypothetical protein
MPLVGNFKILNILPLQSQYIYSILLCITKNKDQFFPNSHIHTINTRHDNNLYVPAANLTLYKKGVNYSGIKIFNHLPTTIKNLSDDKNKFQIALKKFLLNNSFYSLDEYFNTQLTNTVTSLWHLAVTKLIPIPILILNLSITLNYQYS